MSATAPQEAVGTDNTEHHTSVIVGSVRRSHGTLAWTRLRRSGPREAGPIDHAIEPPPAPIDATSTVGSGAWY